MDLSLRCSALVTGSILLLASCAVSPTQPVWQLPGERHKITVKETSDRLNLVLDPGDAGLSLAHKSTILAFARAYRDHGHGPVAISIPAGSANAQIAVRAAAQTREILYDDGLAWAQMVGGHYEARGQTTPPIILSFRRYTASAEGCSVARQNMSHNYSNATSKNFGCFLAVNTAAMIADPYDLVAPQDMTAPPAERRMATYELYVAGESTATERTSDEEGSVSDVVD